MIVSLANTWNIFVSLITVTAPLLGVLTGILVLRQFLVLLLNVFFKQVRDAALKLISKIIKKGG
jgi:hypothetical protein